MDDSHNEIQKQLTDLETTLGAEEYLKEIDEIKNELKETWLNRYMNNEPLGSMPPFMSDFYEPEVVDKISDIRNEKFEKIRKQIEVLQGKITNGDIITMPKPVTTTTKTTVTPKEATSGTTGTTGTAATAVVVKPVDEAVAVKPVVPIEADEEADEASDEASDVAVSTRMKHITEITIEEDDYTIMKPTKTEIDLTIEQKNNIKKYFKEVYNLETFDAKLSEIKAFIDNLFDGLNIESDDNIEDKYNRFENILKSIYNYNKTNKITGTFIMIITAFISIIIYNIVPNNESKEKIMASEYDNGLYIIYSLSKNNILRSRTITIKEHILIRFFELHQILFECPHIKVIIAGNGKGTFGNKHIKHGLYKGSASTETTMLIDHLVQGLIDLHPNVFIGNIGMTTGTKNTTEYFVDESRYPSDEWIHVIPMSPDYFNKTHGDVLNSSVYAMTKQSVGIYGIVTVEDLHEGGAGDDDDDDDGEYYRDDYEDIRMNFPYRYYEQYISAHNKSFSMDKKENKDILQLYDEYHDIYSDLFENKIERVQFYAMRYNETNKINFDNYKKYPNALIIYNENFTQFVDKKDIKGGSGNGKYRIYRNDCHYEQRITVDKTSKFKPVFFGIPTGYKPNDPTKIGVDEKELRIIDRAIAQIIKYVNEHKIETIIYSAETDFGDYKTGLSDLASTKRIDFLIGERWQDFTYNIYNEYEYYLGLGIFKLTVMSPKCVEYVWNKFLKNYKEYIKLKVYALGDYTSDDYINAAFKMKDFTHTFIEIIKKLSPFISNITYDGDIDNPYYNQPLTEAKQYKTEKIYADYTTEYIHTIFKKHPDTNEYFEHYLFTSRGKFNDILKNFGDMIINKNKVIAYVDELITKFNTQSWPDNVVTLRELLNINAREIFGGDLNGNKLFDDIIINKSIYYLDNIEQQNKLMAFFDYVYGTRHDDSIYGGKSAKTIVNETKIANDNIVFYFETIHDLYMKFKVTIDEITTPADAFGGGARTKSLAKSSRESKYKQKQLELLRKMFR